MQRFFILALILMSADFMQVVLLTPFIPFELCPDLMLLVALTCVALLPVEHALAIAFLLGLQADLLASSRFGMLLLSYLLGAGFVMSVQRDLRGGKHAVWLAVIMGAVIAVGASLVLAKYTGSGLEWKTALRILMWKTAVHALIGACVVYVLRQVFRSTKLLNPEVERQRGSRGQGGSLLGFRIG